MFKTPKAVSRNLLVHPINCKEYVLNRLPQYCFTSNCVDVNLTKNYGKKSTGFTSLLQEELQALPEDTSLASLKPLLRDPLKAMFILNLVVNSYCPQLSALYVIHSKKQSS